LIAAIFLVKHLLFENTFMQRLLEEGAAMPSLPTIHYFCSWVAELQERQDRANLQPWIELFYFFDFVLES
jgi:hypothetical protein